MTYKLQSFLATWKEQTYSQRPRKPPQDFLFLPENTFLSVHLLRCLPQPNTQNPEQPGTRPLVSPFPIPISQAPFLNIMRLLARILFAAGLALLAASWGSADDEPQIQSFIDYCAYVGSNLTDGHWLGAYCRNNMTEVFGYNYTWYAHVWPVVGVSGLTDRRDRLDLDRCVGNNNSQLIAYDK